MPKVTPSIAAVLAIALLAFAPAAGAEEIVPPGNSAAAQYTEAFPSPGGERETEGGKQGKAVPADVLGARDSHRLKSKGKDGEAVAEFAAETAPGPVSEPVQQDGEPATEGDGDGRQPGTAGGGAGGGGSAGGGGGSVGGGGSTGATPAAGGDSGPPAAGEQPSGSSGFGEVVGQMTGSSSGELGLLLPLIVIGAIVWSLVYAWRQRQRVL